MDRRIIIETYVREDGRTQIELKFPNDNQPKRDEVMGILVSSISLLIRTYDTKNQAEIFKSMVKQLESQVFDVDDFKDAAIENRLEE